MSTSTGRPQDGTTLGSSRERDITRLINFSDAIVAIAATLLILPLAERATQGDITSFSALVNESGRQILIFLLSFIVICRMWLTHHRLLKSVVGFTLPLFWLNALWLLSIVFLPFPTEILGTSNGMNAFASGIYISTMLITFLSGLFMQWLIIRSPHLLADHAVREQRIYRPVVAVACTTAALILSIAVPPVGPWSLCLLLLSGPIDRVVLRMLQRREGRAGA
jgi:uncharacterized membrane protein